MSNTDVCQLTTKDYTILEVMQERCLGRDDPIRELLRRKLDGATVVFRDDIPPTVVTLSSRVSYRIDDGPAETRIVAHDEMRGMVGSVLSITNPRGLALLGLAEGQSITIRRIDGEEETLTVQEVVYQPEASRREADTLQRGGVPPKPRGPILRLVHRSDDVPLRPKRELLSPFDGGPDDPGPSAA
ncbi:regulator of nucleoside diphosphate kinase [Mesorhizobium soli]|uniref:GreA/GreB family elongation factor n=1 Tax=Pseudaminobacter soli (ex Li et al. 2025) TaxID=1295366 RepID=UPI0024752099|nr:GreA/GreB family elongation factor [Mesorhizobium soli]MDH6230688.1 regulator of nucleoside diphosphate kinase [Mesorhizobium soli]